jgi:hypothetical protein
MLPSNLSVTSSNVTRRASPGVFLYKPLGCSLGRPRLSLSSPGYLPVSRHLLAPSIITQKFVVFGYVRGCCVENEEEK